MIRQILQNQPSRHLIIYHIRKKQPIDSVNGHADSMSFPDNNHFSCAERDNLAVYALVNQNIKMRSRLISD